MNFEDIMNMWDEDVKIDRTELGDESARVSTLHAKYLRLFYNERLKLIKYKKEYNKVKKLMWDYWNGHFSKEDYTKYNLPPQPIKILKADIQMYLDSDPRLSAIHEKLQIQEEIVNYIESIIKHISNRGFQIKNIIDWTKFNSGM